MKRKESDTEEVPNEDRFFFMFDGNKVFIPKDFSHPGGTQIFEKYVGRDISALFQGEDSEPSVQHAHSKAAYTLLSKFIVENSRSREESEASEMNHEATPSTSAQEFQIDESKPLLWQVIKLGNRYESWLRSPVPYEPRFFASDWAENCTKVKWWCIPLLWIPVLILSLRQMWAAGGLTAPQAVAYFIIGILTWQWFEYSLHRFVFHLKPKHPANIFLHFLIHGCHHKYPLDVNRLVFPPLPASLVVYLVHRVLHTLVSYTKAFAIFSGMLFGYIVYDCMHYFIHTGVIVGHLKTAHMRHHFIDDTIGFGISSPLFDFMFGTKGSL